LQFKYPHYTPYQYAGNKPITYIDLDGAEPALHGLLNHLGLAQGGASRLGEAQQVGNYNVVPFYDDKGNLMGYNAGRDVPKGKGTEYRTEYQMSPSDLEGFKENIKLYERIANLIYVNGEPNWAQVAVGYHIARQEFKSAVSSLGETWKNALKDPNFWISTTFSVGFSASVANTNTTVKMGWKVGDPITNLTSKGNIPAWSTVRQRFWKNEFFLNSSKYPDVSNLLRMKKGLAPQFKNPKTGILESMELHHNKVPQRKGGLFEFIKVTPEQHKKIDPFRQ
jgi:hypothetical protein